MNLKPHDSFYNGFHIRVGSFDPETGDYIADVIGEYDCTGVGPTPDDAAVSAIRRIDGYVSFHQRKGSKR